MSRRTGQDGWVELRNGIWRGRFLVDIPGQFARVRKAVTLGSAKEMTKSEARRRLKEVIAAAGINSPQYKIPSTLLFEQHAENWERDYISRMKPSNQALLRCHLKKYLLPKWGKVPVDGITAEKVNQWLGDKAFEHLAPATLRGIVRTLQFALGASFGKRKIHYPSKVGEETEARCFTASEVTSILAAASGQDKSLFTLAAETGMRAGELYGLRVEDIDFARSIVHVRRSMWNGQAQTPKTSNAYRAIDVQPYVTEMLKQHLAGRQTGFVFLTKRETPLQNTNVLHKRLHPLLRQLNVPQGGMHAFRHFRVSFLVQNETPLEIIKRWIGHGSEQMIRHYTHLHPTYCKEVMGRIPIVIAPFAPSREACVVN